MIQGVGDVPPQQLVCGLLEYQWGKAENTHISGSRIENGDRALCSMDVCYKDTSLWEWY